MEGTYGAMVKTMEGMAKIGKYLHKRKKRTVPCPLL